VYAEGKGQFRSIAKMSVRANILNMSKIYDRTIYKSAIMLFMNHQGPLEAPSMVACFHHKIPTGLYFVQDAAGLLTFSSSTVKTYTKQEADHTNILTTTVNSTDFPY